MTDLLSRSAGREFTVSPVHLALLLVSHNVRVQKNMHKYVAVLFRKVFLNIEKQIYSLRCLKIQGLQYEVLGTE